MMQSVMKGSWKTTVAGVLAALGAVASAAAAYLDGDPATDPDWKLVGVALAAAWGLINARDDKVTSEQVGARPPSDRVS